MSKVRAAGIGMQLSWHMAVLLIHLHASMMSLCVSLTSSRLLRNGVSTVTASLPTHSEYVGATPFATAESAVAGLLLSVPLLVLLLTVPLEAVCVSVVETPADAAVVVFVLLCVLRAVKWCADGNEGVLMTGAKGG